MLPQDVFWQEVKNAWKQLCLKIPKILAVGAAVQKVFDAMARFFEKFLK